MTMILTEDKLIQLVSNDLGSLTELDRSKIILILRWLCSHAPTGLFSEEPLQGEEFVSLDQIIEHFAIQESGL